MTPTQEQLDVIFSDDKEIYLPSLAGTGKTTTLIEYTKIHKYSKILYIVRNTKMRMEAVMRFPERVDCHTGHSLAYGVFGKGYEVSDLELSKIAEVTGLTIRESYEVSKLLTSYFGSSVGEIKDINSPLVSQAEVVWSKIKNKEIPMPHDGYLKLYQLSRPDLSHYDIILVDEFQDISAALYDIVDNQPGSVRVYVGDMNQQIYGFSGAINGFAGKSIKYRLVQSFRFGPEIAAVANRILETSGTNERVIGTDNIDSVVLHPDQDPDDDEHQTIIFRTNTLLFNEAISMTRKGIPISIEDADNIFNRILNALNLKERKPIINDKYIESFKNFNDFYAAAKVISEFKFILKLINNYGPELRESIKSLQRLSCRDAKFHLITAHKAKGLEFVNVRLANDFAKIESASREELNLIYVAATRATHYLTPNKDLQSIL